MNFSDEIHFRVREIHAARTSVIDLQEEAGRKAKKGFALFEKDTHTEVPPVKKRKPEPHGLKMAAAGEDGAGARATDEVLRLVRGSGVRQPAGVPSEVRG